MAKLTSNCWEDHNCESVFKLFISQLVCFRDWEVLLLFFTCIFELKLAVLLLL